MDPEAPNSIRPGALNMPEEGEEKGRRIEWRQGKENRVNRNKERTIE